MAILRHSVCVRFVDSSRLGTNHAAWNVARLSRQPRCLKGAAKVEPKASGPARHGWLDEVTVHAETKTAGHINDAALAFFQEVHRKSP